MEKKGLKKLWSKGQEKELKDLADKGFFSKEDYENGKRLREAFGFKAKEKEYTQGGENLMSDGIEKIKSPLRKAMSELDYGIPEYVFDSEEGCEVHALIQKVWNEIDKLKYGEEVSE